MRMKNEDVIAYFLNGRGAESHTGNLVSDNGKLINYGTTLAQWVELDNGIQLVINETKYSVTTSKIQSQLRRQAFRYESVEGVPIGSYDLGKYVRVEA